VKVRTQIRASHVNSGTALSRRREIQTGRGGRVLRHGKLHPELCEEATSSRGGLALAVGVARQIGLPSLLDTHLQLLKVHRPYTEADHVLTHAYNLFVGGECIEDIAALQSCSATRAILGADAIPDPTTAGDFLRRFDAESIQDLDQAIDKAQAAVWQRRWKNRKQPEAHVDLDSHLHEVYGDKKEGSDFCRKGYLAYHPLVISLAGTGECLRLVNRPGNVNDAHDADLYLDRVMDLVCVRFREVVVRGDSKFFNQKIFDVVEKHGQKFAVVSPSFKNLIARADEIPEDEWKRFRARKRHQPCEEANRRHKRANHRAARVDVHDKRDLALKKQWVAEFEYTPKRSKSTYRIIVRRQKITERRVGGELFDLWRYRFAISNIRNRSATEILHLTYKRCDQEKTIEQLQNGLAAMRMPTGSAIANAAFLTIARIANNLKPWIVQLARLGEVIRWSWKRFRYHFVYVAARVIHTGRRAVLRILGDGRSPKRLLEALQRF